MTFTAAIKSAFSNYAVFTGRATRSEYWWFYLFVFILNTVIEVAAELGDSSVLASLVSLAFALAILVPSIALATRHLHDVDRSGWWQLIGFTIIGLIPLLYWLVKKGTDGPNRFGEDRLAALAASQTTSIVT
jgi:uncharacterized membrane protein YhaH (DUF805 family)